MPEKIRRRSGNPNPHQAVHKHMKNIASVPRRERWLVQLSLENLHLRYWEAIIFWNPQYTGLRRRVNGGWQWLDFVVRTPYGKLALIFKPQYGGSRAHLFEKRALAEKKAFLDDKGIPYLILSRMHSREQYEIILVMWMRKKSTSLRLEAARQQASGEQDPSIHRPHPQQQKESRSNPGPLAGPHDELPSTS
jgi:hypothetical protein